MRLHRSFLLAGVVAATMTACSSVGGGTSTTAAGGHTAGTSPSSRLKVAFVSQVEGIPYFESFKQGAEQEAAKLGISYTQAGPSTADSTQQLQIFNSLITQGYKVIAISPLDPSSLDPAIAAARGKGVDVITADADAPDSERQVFVEQATNQALGYTAMDQIAQQTHGTGEYGIISGAPDTETFTNWIKYIELRQQARYPQMKLVGGIQYTTSTAQALSAAQNVMTANPGLKALIAIPSTAVPGVAQAVRNAGKTGQIAVTGYGSPKTALPYVEDGVMHSTILWDVPELGALAVWAMQQVYDGKTFQPANTVPGFTTPIHYDPAQKTLILGPPTVFTKTNITNYNF